MEIKIQCNCGTKFKFEVEPVHGRMPAPIACPSCGADATAAANDILRQMEPPASAPAPIPSVRLATPHPSQPSPPSHASDAPQAPAPPPPFPKGQARPASRPKSRVAQVLTAVLTVLLVAFGLWRFGGKWYNRLKAVAEVASAAGEASVEDKSEGQGAKNLWYEKCAILFIRASNHLAVAEAMQQYWKTNFHKNLQLIDSPMEAMDKGEFELISPHNGYVRILGAFEWPLHEFEGLARHLSQRFGTLVFEWRNETFAETYHFGVYDQGVRKFHAQMDVKITNDNADEIVTTEGNDYAIANGFKPGPDGFKNFHVLEADKITQHLGMRLWDEPEGKEIKGMLLRETGAVK